MLNRIQKTINIIDDYIDTMYKDYGDGIKKLPESERKKVTSADEIIKEAEDKNVTVYVISAAAVLCAVGVFTVVRKKGKKCVR